MKDLNKHYYHCATKGLPDDILFSSREQFIAGMNRVGFCLVSLNFSVIIIAFVLMDNHVHFILYGTEEECKKFMDQYKRFTEIWLGNNSPNEQNKRWDIGCWIISNKEKLMEKICYVLRNPLVAGMGVHPLFYPWGSGLLMFTSTDKPSTDANLTAVGEISTYQQRKLFKTKIKIPSEWLITPEGMIWPGSYVSYKRAEAAFDSVYNFMYELNKKIEDVVNQEMYGSDISLPDKDVLVIARSSAADHFNENDLDLLSIPDRLELCRILHKTHSIDIKQVGRLLHLKPSDLKLIW